MLASKPLGLLHQIRNGGRINRLVGIIPARGFLRVSQVGYLRTRGRDLAPHESRGDVLHGLRVMIGASEDAALVLLHLATEATSSGMGAFPMQ